MDNYTLITDVTADLDASTYEELGVVCIPMGFMFGETEYMHYPDGREMSVKTFYERLEAGEMPKTAQINPLVYHSYFEASLKEGKDVLYLCFSSGLSGSYATASMIARELETIVRNDIARCCQWFTVENLMHLRRGGRLNSIEAIVGSALKIQPVLTIDPEGKLTVVSKERGTRNALQYLMRRLREEAKDPETQTMLIAHADCPEKAELLRAMVAEAYPQADLRMYDIGPIIGSHVGNGMCALVFGGARKDFPQQ